MEESAIVVHPVHAVDALPASSDPTGLVGTSGSVLVKLILLTFMDFVLDKGQRVFGLDAFEMVRGGFWIGAILGFSLDLSLTLFRGILLHGLLLV